MYSKFFGLKENPFKLSTNPSYLFLGKSHEEALAHLVYAVSQGEGFVSLIGKRGVGKTTICRAFIESRDQSTEVAYILNPHLTPKKLLSKINSEFDITAGGDDTKALIDSLNEFLMQKRLEGKKVVLFLDDSQKLDPAVLEQVRLLSNLETTRDKLLQIILVGDSELVDMLRSPALRQIGQRVSVSYHIKPLSSAETRSYIEHRIGICSREDPVQFDASALKRIAKYSGGIPRMINIVCDKSLATAHRLNCNRITGDIAKAAILDLKGRSGWQGFGSVSRRGIIYIAIGCSFMVILVISAIFFRPTSKKSLPAKVEVKTFKIEDPPAVEANHIPSPDEEQIAELSTPITELPEEDKPAVETASSTELAPETDSSTPEKIEMTHSVQVGAFLTKEYSVDLVDTLQQKGYDARIVVITDSKERTWYTVRIGDYPSHNGAQQYAEAFSSRENMQTAVRPYGKF